MFKNRLDAAKQLAEKIKKDSIKNVNIIALTPGGRKIAKYLKKLLPSNPNQQNLTSVLIVDDGNISSQKLTHAVKLYRSKNPKKIIIGLPVYKHEEILKLENIADAVYTVSEPETFVSAAEFYQDL